MNSTSDSPLELTFGRFRVLPERREVLADGWPIKLGGRAFEVLMALIEARGAVVSKEALMARVWPGRIIEENSLAAQIAALRAAFGAERELIRTVSGRGYQFTGEIRVVPASPGEAVGAVAAQPASVPPPTNVPEPVSELIGREEEFSEILNLVTTHWLVTVTGAGGIGKTTLALALARELRPHFADGVWLAEFSALADPGLVPATVAAAVGLELGGGEASAQRVAQALADRRLLLVLDTCEHVIAAAATMVEAMLGAGSALHIIATSREPLRAGGEWVYPVQPLAVPAMDVAADDDPLQYGAVRLFIERARAAEPRFAPDRRLMAMIVAICRRLDGIPLAIELAATRAPALGIEALAARLDDRFRLLTGGRRTALPRHQALRATLDWSYELLAEPERVILRRLAVFAGSFSLDGCRRGRGQPGSRRVGRDRGGVGGWQTACLRHAGTVSATPGVRPEHRRKNIDSVTFGIGDLLVHALHTTAPDVDLGLTLSEPGVVIPLFPVVGEIMWPPARSISADEAAFLANTLDRLFRSHRVRWQPLPT